MRRSLSVASARTSATPVPARSESRGPRSEYAPGSLAAKSALIRRVEQRYPVSASDPRVEFVDLTLHLCRSKPVGQRMGFGKAEWTSSGQALRILDVRVQGPACSSVMWRLSLIIIKIRTARLGPSSAEKVGLRPSRPLSLWARKRLFLCRFLDAGNNEDLGTFS
jgi:hypothetical protein